MEIAKHAVSAAARRTGRREPPRRANANRRIALAWFGSPPAAAPVKACAARARRPAAHRMLSARCAAVRQVKHRMGSALGANGANRANRADGTNGTDACAAAGGRCIAPACSRMHAMRQRMRPDSAAPAGTMRGFGAAATLCRELSPSRAARFADTAAACACERRHVSRQNNAFATAHAAGPIASAAPRCLNEARRELFLCVATKLSQHAIIVVVRNDNGNRARPTTKKCRMSSDCNSARVARRIDAFRFRTFLDVDCIGASGARAERPDSPAVRVESGTRRDGRLD
ncbi:hypothetical protein [Burkholderia pseudomallei]|uniref:hypothetical protein n=2 Tax=Burkholderia pseudomallei TaxID=28450 RepID=UPI0012AECF57|nr:hypothetical protein [Burkholderia pseudomallei]